MKKLNLLFIFVVLCLLSQIRTSENPSGLSLDPVEIQSISTSMTMKNYNRKGSIMGGTQIYIIASGLDQTYSNNKIKIGPYECVNNLLGVGGLYISCITVFSWDKNRRQDQPVVIEVNKKNPSTCILSKQCSFTYSDDETPFFERIYLQDIVPGTEIGLQGVWRISNINQMSLIKVSDEYLCDMFVDSVNPNEEIIQFQSNLIQCIVSKENVAGRYNFTFENVNGYPINTHPTYAFTSDGRDKYQLLVKPEIKKISSNEGSPMGQNIMIEGNGFGNNAENVSVDIGGIACDPTMVSSHKIECKVMAGTPTSLNGMKSAGSGLLYTNYILKTDKDFNSASKFATQLIGDLDYFAAGKTHHDKIISVEKGYLGSLSRTTFAGVDISNVYHIRGWFYAKKAGIHNFVIQSKDSGIIYFNKLKNSNDRSKLVVVAEDCAGKVDRFYYTPPDACDTVAKRDFKQRSQDIDLELGERYLIEIFTYNAYSKGSFSIAVETPGSNEVDEVFLNSRFGVQKVELKLSGAGGRKMGGTFQLTFNGTQIITGGEFGQQIDIPFDIKYSDLEKDITRSLQIYDIKVQGDIDVERGQTFYIYFYGVQGDIPKIKADAGNLNGGPNNKPTIEVTHVIKGDNRPFFDPIQSDMLGIISENPQVVVTVNGIKSQPQIDLALTKYDVNSAKTPTATSFTQTGTSLSVDFTDAQNVVTQEKLSITFAENKCGSISISGGTISCTLVANSDQSAMLIAGTHIPIIHLDKIGFFQTSSLTGQVIPLTLTTISPTVGSVNGGITITLTGAGFPFDMMKAKDLQVMLKTTPAKITMVNNKEIQVILPPSPGQTEEDVQLKVKYGSSESTTKTFTYNTNGLHNLISISPIVSSPVLKGDITLTGTNFGTDKSKVKVFLDKEVDNKREEYLQLNVLTVSDTEITAFLSGGKTGQYYVRVYIEGKGNNLNSNVKFKYEVKLTDIQPSSGSNLGGQLITITGGKFSEKIADMKVYFQEKASETYLLCNIITVTETQITCKSPAKSSKLINNKVYVVVESKLLEDSVCKESGDCRYTYSDQKTGSLNKQGQTLEGFGGDKIRIVGTLFTGKVNIEIGQKVFPTTVKSDTEIEVTVPENLGEGTYLAIVNIESKGIAGFFNLKVKFSVDPLTSRDISQKGDIITVNGSGFNAQILEVIFNKDKCTILSVTPTQIIFKTPYQEKAGSKTITYKQLTELECNDCLQVSLKNSPKILSFSNQYFTTPAQISITFTQQTGLIDIVTERANTIVQLISIVDSKDKYNGTVTDQNQFVFTNIPSGSYKLEYRILNVGYGEINGNGSIIIESQPNPLTAVETSFAGGKMLEITGASFNKKNSFIEVCGFQCPIDQNMSTDSSLKCDLPMIVTNFITENLEIEKKVEKLNFDVLDKQQKVIQGNATNYAPFNVYRITSSNDDDIPNLSDNKLSTAFSTPQNETMCFIQYDFGPNILVQVTKIEFEILLYKQLYYYEGLQFQGSNDATVWKDIVVLTPRSDNYWVHNADTDPASYRYVRVYDSVTTGTANCELTELSLFGYRNYKNDITSLSDDLSCPVNLFQNGVLKEFGNKVTYKNSLTATVTEITPNYGWIKGGTTITIKGSGFGTDKSVIQVTLDTIDCTIQSVTNTQISCVTGDKNAAFEDNNNAHFNQVRVTKNGNKAIVKKGASFYYGLLYSEIETWGGDTQPRAGDLVQIPKVNTLIVDQSTPIIETLIVEGNIIFADMGTPINLNSHVIIVRDGLFIVGSEEKPYTSKLTITLYGKLIDKQLPVFGNKVLGCSNCKFEMHGVEKNPAWTMLKTTADVDATSITVLVNVDWLVGDEIVIASTDFDHKHAEQVKITAVSGKRITFTPALKFKHYSNVDTFGSHQIPMRAEVGCLSRNVVIQGDPKDSLNDKYGAHTMFHGSAAEGLRVRMESIEFRNSGQPKITGRYAIHFHMVGEQSQSYVKNNAVHDSNARIITIHATHYLKVINNVGYKCVGHNIFLEDGIETYNRIERNLIVSTRRSESMLQTDLTSACIWITHPTNYIIGNHAAGSDFYGIWYEVKDHPDGPSARRDICPRGMPLGENRDNVAHSNVRFGMRFFVLAPRNNPCKNISDTNKPILQTYSNFTTFKNGESGILAEFMGEATFTDIKMIDNIKSGFMAYVTNFTALGTFKLKDSVIVLDSITNSEEPADVPEELNRSAISFPRTNGFKASNIDVFNVLKYQFIVESMAENDHPKLWPQGGKQSTLEGITCTNCDQGKWIKWLGGPISNIVADMDGSLTKSGQQTYITPYQRYENKGPIYTHFDKMIADNVCTKNTDKSNLPMVICSVPLRMVQFQAFDKFEIFLSGDLKIFSLNDKTDEQFKAAQLDQFGEYPQEVVKKSYDGEYTYVGVLAVGYTYNIHFSKGIDFKSLQVVTSKYAEAKDKPIILRFNHSAQRELFESQRISKDKKVENFSASSKPLFNQANMHPVDTCKQGAWQYDESNKYYYFCVSGDKPDIDDNIRIEGIFCRDNCPKSDFICDRIETIAFSTGQFQSRTAGSNDEYVKKKPKSGEDVVINCTQTVTFDVANFEFGNLYIDGDLEIADNIPEVTITATNIWIRGGKLTAGNKTTPFPNKLKFILKGDQDSQNLNIDDISDPFTKAFTVTGRLELYGKEIATTWTKLIKNAVEGDTEIHVISSEDWKVGDKLILGPTEFKSPGSEEVTIKSIKSAGVLKITEAIKNFHYGSPKPTAHPTDGINIITEKYGGELDMRCGVGHLNRSIQIMGSMDGGLGGHLQIYHWYSKSDYETIDFRGSADLSYVELYNMGQYNSHRGAINILYTNRNSSDNMNYTNLTGLSIHHSGGIGFNGVAASNVILFNSVIYKAERYLISNLMYPTNFQIKNNLLIDCNKREKATERDSVQWDPIIGLNMWEEYNKSSGLEVQNNYFQGIQGVGAAIHSMDCDQKEFYPFKDNTFGMIDLVGVIIYSKLTHCQYSADVSIYHTLKGFITAAKGVNDRGFIIENIRAAENSESLALRHGSMNIRIHTNVIKNVFVSALLRTDCEICYQKSPMTCQENWGMQLALSSVGGEHFPITKTPLGFDVLCIPTSTYQTAYVQGSRFHNFKKTHEDKFSNCSSKRNYAIKNHATASDATASHYFTDTECEDCQEEAIFKIDQPRQAWRGWHGGCGDMDCTGLYNILMQDMDGKLTGKIRSIISNNEQIFKSDDMRSGCSYKNQQNLYYCDSMNFGSLEFEGISGDKDKVQSAPVYVDNGMFRNKINMWREWGWQGPEPLNTRQNTFQSLIMYNQTYKIEFSGKRPVTMFHRLAHQKEGGDSSNWIIFRYNYDTPQSIQVVYTNSDTHQEIKKSLPSYGKDRLEDNLECGNNIYFYENNTVFVVLTGEADCGVIVRLINSVQVSMRLSMKEEDFLKDSKTQTNLIDRIAAFLSITTDRIRIVGLKKRTRLRILAGEELEVNMEILAEEPIGGTSVQTSYDIDDGSGSGTVDPLTNFTVKYNNKNYSQTEELSKLTQVAQKLNDPNEIKKLVLDGDVTYVIEAVKVEVAPDPLVNQTTTSNTDTNTAANTNQSTTLKSEESSNGLAIGLGVFFGILVVVGLGLLSFRLYNKKKFFQQLTKVSQNESEQNDLKKQQKQIISAEPFQESEQMNQQKSSQQLDQNL